VHLQPQKQYALQTGDKIRFGFDTHEYRFINFGLLDAGHKELDKTVANEAITQFVEDNKLYDIKQLPKAASANGKAGESSEIEASLNALVEKLETEAILLAQKLELQQKELQRVNSEAEGATEMRKAFDQDREVVDSAHPAHLETVCAGKVHHRAAEEVHGPRARHRREERADQRALRQRLGQKP